MTTRISFGLLLLLSCVSMVTCQNAGTDLTRAPGSSGESVVRATVLLIRESCVFQNDYLFLRRLAYVSSSNGLNPNTYRAGYHGGIWQISQEDYQNTLSVPNIDYDRIKVALNVDWKLTSWSDLRKPLYSGIAAMLTLERLSPIPRDLQRQAEFYQTKLSGQASVFLAQLAGYDSACATDELDMAFVLDASGSISSSEYKKSKNFTAEVIGYFNVGYDSVRVALTSYSSSVSEQIQFLEYNTTESLQKAVLAAYKNSGGTNTNRALDNLRTSIFKKNNSRKEAAKIAIVQTDGNSGSRSATIAAADLLKDEGVTVFAIGVGNGIDRVELEGIATEPNCTHVRMIADFSELNSIASDIKEAACKAEFIPIPNSTTTYKCSGEKTLKIELSLETSIVMHPALGNVNIFGSFKITQPNSAFADFSSVATDGKPTVIYLENGNETLYLSVVAEVSNGDECDSTFLVKVLETNALRKTAASNLCIKNSQQQACSDLDYVKSGDFEQVNASNTARQVCQDNSMGYFPHPDTITKYVYCVSSTEAYEVNCPDGFAYLDSQQDCIAPVSTDSDKVCQVCTQENLELGLKKFPLVSNNQQFVNCSRVDTCVVLGCGDDTRYLPNEQRCSDPPINTGNIVRGSFAAMWIIYFVQNII
ncbi:uncharacterized protein LOC101847901 [Aplysia californica]|uniref:Uncharacterized protein LOC101847901 n=1 Tax=Aplysia californica TaxID=6500 RepID=A0ABM0K2J5_APLCA|nr:uncharacterized protein LOC101847901 [Aplysia californica]